LIYVLTVTDISLTFMLRAKTSNECCIGRPTLLGEVQILNYLFSVFSSVLKYSASIFLKVFLTTVDKLITNPYYSFSFMQGIFPLR
jgi:hypothetical protein